MKKGSDKEKGLYQKYKVERVDGKSIEGGCLVLEFRDWNAWPAINAFALSVGRAGYEDLSADILDKLKIELGRIKEMPEEDLDLIIQNKGLDSEEVLVLFQSIAGDVLAQCSDELR